MSAPAIIDPRAAWLKERRRYLGASDVAAVLGADPYRGPLAVYLSKVGEDDFAEKRWMRFGRLVEGAIAEGYREDTGRPVRDLGAHELQVHPDVGFLAATLDRQTQGNDLHPAPAEGPAPLECKAVAGMKARDWDEEPPLHFQIQVQAQMACTGAQWGSLCALFGGVAIRWLDLVRHDAFLARALPVLETFWLRVQRREPPEADALPGTSAAIRAAWADEDGETVTLGPEVLEILDRLDAAKLLRDAEGEHVDEAENQIRALMGGASFAALPDGSLLTLRKIQREAYTVKETSYRTLRRIRPRLRRR